MRRRTAVNGYGGRLARFRLEDWATGPGDANDFYRYEAALHAWFAARDEWAESTGWKGDETWWMAAHEAIVAMPDEPWNPEAI